MSSKLLAASFMAAISVFAPRQLKAQQFNYLDSDNFNGIHAEGKVPADFTESWAAKFQLAHTAQQLAGEGRSEREKLQKFWSSQYYFIDNILHSGRVSFNDPITQYLNRIKDELLKDDQVLREEVRVYLNKSPFVNASTVADGIILFNTGLFAYANTEAELAFVLAHEIQHYKQGHLFESFEKREKILQEKLREYRRLHPLEQLDLLTMQDQEHEFDADEQGLELFLKSQYAKVAPDGVFDILHHSYIPYGRKEVGEDFLTTATARLPSAFFRDSVSPITREEDYFDETHSHPNIARRREALESVLNQRKGGQADFVQAREQFLALRELARFERVRELVMYGMYGDALYDIYVLRDTYSHSKFLDISEAKSLYALAGFKTSRGAFNDVARSTSRIEGPSQQVHHIIKQFDKYQITAYALHVLRETQKKYPEENYLEEYASELTKYLVLTCHLSAQDFKVSGTGIPPFEDKVEDYRSERLFLRAQQKHYADFYKYLLQEDYQSGWLAKAMGQHKPLMDSVREHYNLDARTKHKRQKEIEKAREEGAHIKINQVVILDPSLYMQKEDQDPKDFYKNFEKELEFKNALPEIVNEVGIDAVFLYSDQMTENDVETYNYLAQLKEWITEANLHNEYDLLPPGVDIADKISALGNTRYVCTIHGRIVDGLDEYIFKVYDLKQGKIVYHHKDTKGFNLSLRDLLKEAAKDFDHIYN